MKSLQSCYAITCGVYGEMVHTAFCDEEHSIEIYEAMRKELQDFIDTETTSEVEQDFYAKFTAKY